MSIIYIYMCMAVLCVYLYNKRICITWQYYMYIHQYNIINMYVYIHGNMISWSYIRLFRFIISLIYAMHLPTVVYTCSAEWGKTSLFWFPLSNSNDLVCGIFLKIFIHFNSYNWQWNSVCVASHIKK